MSSEVLYIVWLLATGFAMGFVFDVYNTVTGASKWLRWLRPTVDVAFWVVSALFVYYVLFLTDEGRVRIYTFGIILVGYGVYRSTMHRLVVRSAFAIVRVVQAVLGAVYRVVYMLTILPIVSIAKVALAVLRIVYRILCVIESCIFRLLEFWLSVLLIRWLLRLPFVQAFFSRIRGGWEEMLTAASNWLKSKWSRV
jgi:spore cortex biosynthesis protein YabQ